jgi:hypothetical protein
MKSKPLLLFSLGTMLTGGCLSDYGPMSRDFYPEQSQYSSPPRRVPKELTVNDHLRVQAAIERRAYELWRAGGRGQGDALSHWVQAEDEVMREFCRTKESVRPL